MKGIDISSNQTNIDFSKVKASGVEIVYIKSTEGLTYDNPAMRLQYNNAKSANLKVGFYHYLRANNAVQEAEHMLRTTQGLPVDCKYIIDVEEVLGQTKLQINSNVRRFADYLISKGLEVGIYTGDNFYSTVLDCTVKNIPLWVAHYGVNKPDASNYVGFQSTDIGRVNGINGYCDIDDFSSGILLNNIASIVENLQFKINMFANIQGSGVTSTTGINTCKIGTIGQSKRLEAFSMTIDGIDFNISTHEQTIGDTAIVGEGAVVGKIGMGKRIEGITINVLSIPTGYKLQYRANIQNLGLTTWMDSGTYCGTKDKALRVEEIEVQIIKL